PFWIGQLMSGWYPLVFLCFMIGAVSWLRLSSASVRDDPDDFAMLSTDIEDYPPEILDEELALRA
ncbi:MAG: glycosyltransferase 87 family protein, partial [[Mycobacterium] stephanolepidis]